TQELYDRLKRKEMTAATQSAAFESVDDVLGNVGSRAGHLRAPQQSLLSKQQGQHETPQYSYDPSQGFGHQRDGSNGNGGSGGMMPPPPLRRPGAFGNHLFGIRASAVTMNVARLIHLQETATSHPRSIVPSWDQESKTIFRGTPVSMPQTRLLAHHMFRALRSDCLLVARAASAEITLGGTV
ncbi:MAG: hypothetical protein L6R42_007121, partial [Xanthoria sp. 1 TBL-2021]